MPKINRKNLIMRSIGLLGAVFLALGIILASWQQLTTARQTNSDDLTDELIAGRRFGQTFQAPFSALYRVDVALSTCARQNQGRLLFHLYDTAKESKIATVEIDAAQVRGNFPQRFTFAPIADSADREFYFYLEAPQAKPGNAVTVRKTSFDAYFHGQAYIDDQPTTEDLRFVAYYHSSPQEAWDTLAERTRSGNPYLWQVRRPVLGIGLALILGVGVLLGEILIARENTPPVAGKIANAAPPARPFTGTWIVLLFTVLALLRGLIYIAIIPPWQSPDEYGHFEYAWLVSEYGPFVGPEAIPPDFQQRMLEITAQHDYWHQIGDRPLYYALAGSVLRLTGNQDLITGMYVGRIVSATLYAAAVGLTVLTTRRLFSQSLFMQITPPAFVLFLPMLGEIGTSVSNGAMGVLSSTLFLASLVPIFRDGPTRWRVGRAIATLALALLSNKTALFVVPTALLAFPIYGWTRRVTPSRRAKLVLATCATLLIATGIALTLIPGGDAARWIEKTGSCGPTRIEGKAYDGKAAIRIGPCADEMVAQSLPSETVEEIAGQRVILSGQVRSNGDSATGQMTVWDNEGETTAEIHAQEAWQHFTLPHTIDPDARHAAVRLNWVGGGALLFDELKLSSAEGKNLLLNDSAEEKESLLLDLLAGIGSRVWTPLRRVERLFMLTSWSPEAWQEYLRRALFSFHSFWGNFGWLALPLPPTWYRTIELACVLALIGSVLFVFKRPRRTWQTGYYFLLMTSFCLLLIQILLPMVIHRGTLWLPQGRYLLPGMFAIAVLMAWGTRQFLPRRWERQATAIAVGAMAGFDMLCLAYLIVPYFYR